MKDAMSHLIHNLRVPVACVTILGLLAIALTVHGNPADGNSGDLVPLIERIVIAAAALLIAYLSLWPTRSQVPEEARLLRAVAEGIREVVFVKDLHGKYLFINQAGAKLVGKAPGEIVGHSAAELFSPDFARALDLASASVLVTGQASRVEHDLPTACGVRSFCSTKVPYRNGKGEVVGVMGVAHDITEQKQIEAELRRSHEQLTDVLESITDGMYTCDHEWRFTYINRRAKELLQLSEADLGQVLWQVRPEATGSIFERQFDQVMKNRISTVFEAEYDARHWEVHAYPTKEGIAVYFQDVTASKRERAALAESEQRYRFVAKATSDIIWDWDVRTGQVYFNSAIQTVLGYRETDIETKEHWWWSRVHQDDRDRLRAKMKASFAGTSETWSGEYRFRRGDGTYADILDRAYVVRDASGSVTRAIGAMQDQTERKHAAKLQQEHEGLREAVAAMEQVLGVVGHELRSPLASIRLLSEFLLMDAESNPATWRDSVDRIHGVTISMAEAVDGLLEAARLNSGKATWKWGRVHLADVCAELATVIRPLLVDKPVCFDVDVDPATGTMTGDAGAIRRMLVNFVTNACKHTRDGRVSLLVRRTGPGEITFTIEDTGAGMNPQTLSRLGIPFALNAGGIGANHATGSGLGVSICRTIVAAHGGTIRVRSSEGHGTTVTVTVRADLTDPCPAAVTEHSTDRVITVEGQRPNGTGSVKEAA